jgi:hypothetical protein
MTVLDPRFVFVADHKHPVGSRALAMIRLCRRIPVA